MVERGGRLKQVRLPAGSIGIRTAPGRMVVRDDEALLDWCKKSLPAAIVITERASVTAVRQALRWITR